LYILYVPSPGWEISILIRIFKSGKSLDVGIPKELAFASEAQDPVVERVGNTLVFGIAAGSAKNHG
jgi:hypothetical protein